MASTSPTGAPAPKEDDEGVALDDRGFEINPEVLWGVPSLPGLDEIEVFRIRPGSLPKRLAEGLTIHVVGTGVATMIGFLFGMVFRSLL
jgi:hypothetical protein